MTASLKSARKVPLAGAVFLVFLGFGSAIVSTGCGDSAPGCVPGQSIACSRGDCEGHQVCQDDGKAYGECTCGGPSNGEFPETGPNSGLIGAACTFSENCREGLDCLTSDSSILNGQGPSAGICLARCVPEFDFCDELDARSKCVVLDVNGTPNEELDDVAYCLPGCELGTQPNELDKCRSRIDLVCSEAPQGSGVGYCRPACRSNVDCGGRFCDLSTGLCGDLPRSGDPIGAECNPEATESTCAGGCLEHGSGYAECSGVCSYGTAGCGETGATLPLDNYCYLDPTGSSGVGDLGYCVRVCDCDRDCDRDDAVCEPKPELEPETGRAGVCAPRTFASGAERPNTPC